MAEDIGTGKEFERLDEDAIVRGKLGENADEWRLLIFF